MPCLSDIREPPILCIEDVIQVVSLLFFASPFMAFSQDEKCTVNSQFSL
jgi:hypothetical protein